MEIKSYLIQKRDKNRGKNDGQKTLKAPTGAGFRKNTSIGAKILHLKDF